MNRFIFGRPEFGLFLFCCLISIMSTHKFILDQVVYPVVYVEGERGKTSVGDFFVLDLSPSQDSLYISLNRTQHPKRILMIG